MLFKQPLCGHDHAILSGKTPKALSEYGFFSDALNQIPNEGVVPYELITALFSDYTDKHRFVYLPDGTTAKYDGEDVFDFPIGTALIKTFSYQTNEGGTLLLETRLLLNKEDGWDALTYVWDIDRGDAFLALGGKTIEVADVVTPTNANFIRYRAPNKNQCKECQKAKCKGSSSRNSQLFSVLIFPPAHVLTCHSDGALIIRFLYGEVNDRLSHGSNVKNSRRPKAYRGKR